MSILNASSLLKEDGLLNVMLPVCGWVDHGFYQFSPSFFYAIDRKEFSLEKLYFWIYDRSTPNLIIWDGLSEEFKEHVHGAFDGSFAANCMEFLDMPIMAWAVLRKKSEIPEQDFMLNTQQLVYKAQWGQQDVVDKINKSKLKLFNRNLLIRPYLMKKYLQRIATPLKNISAIEFPK